MCVRVYILNSAFDFAVFNDKPENVRNLYYSSLPFHANQQ